MLSFEPYVAKNKTDGKGSTPLEAVEVNKFLYKEEMIFVSGKPIPPALDGGSESYHVSIVKFLPRLPNMPPSVEYSTSFEYPTTAFKNINNLIFAKFANGTLAFFDKDEFLAAYKKVKSNIAK